MGLSIHNKPTRQEFEYSNGNNKRLFISEKCEYAQCLNGAKIINFTFNDSKMSIDGNQYELHSTSVIDEVGEGEDSVCYVFFKSL